MKKNLAVLLLTMAMTVTGLAGCGGEAPPAEESASAEKTTAEGENDTAAYTFGFITLADSDVWCKSVCTSFEEYVAATYPKCEVVTADGNSDANLQIQAVENFIAQKVDVIVLQPADADATGPAIEAANAAGIPVITTAIRSNSGDYTYVGPENIEAGKMHAQFVMDNCEAGAKILYLQGTAGLSHSTDRYNGFIQGLDEAGFDYELLAAQDGDYLRTEGLRITEDWIQKYQEFDVIVSSNDQMALGAIEALKGANIEGVIVLGLDATDDARAEIKAGTMAGSLKQDAAAIAQTSADLSVEAAGGAEIEDTYVEWVMITAENVDVD